MSAYNSHRNGLVSAKIAMGVFCRIMKRYGPKALAFIDHCLAISVITQAQHDQVVAFLLSVDTLCVIFELLANQQGA